VPHTIDLSVLFWNKKLYAKAGLDPEKGPSSLKELAEQATPFALNFNQTFNDPQGPWLDARAVRARSRQGAGRGQCQGDGLAQAALSAIAAMKSTVAPAASMEPHGHSAALAAGGEPRPSTAAVTHASRRSSRAAVRQRCQPGTAPAVDGETTVCCSGWRTRTGRRGRRCVLLGAAPGCAARGRRSGQRRAARGGSRLQRVWPGRTGGDLRPSRGRDRAGRAVPGGRSRALPRAGSAVHGPPWRGPAQPRAFGSEYFADRAGARSAGVRGHAVRALYLAAGAVDVAIETGDDALLAALVRQWQRIVAARTFLTGRAATRARHSARTSSCRRTARTPRPAPAWRR